MNWLTISQAAARLSCSERTIRNYIADGLKVTRVNKRVLRIAESDLDEFMRRNEARVNYAQPVSVDHAQLVPVSFRNSKNGRKRA